MTNMPTFSCFEIPLEKRKKIWRMCSNMIVLLFRNIRDFILKNKDQIKFFVFEIKLYRGTAIHWSFIFKFWGYNLTLETGFKLILN